MTWTREDELQITHHELWSLAEVLFDLAMALVAGEDSIVARGFMVFPCILHPSIGAFLSCNELLTFVLAIRSRMPTKVPKPEPWSCLVDATVSFCVAFTDANLVVTELAESQKYHQAENQKQRDNQYPPTPRTRSYDTPTESRSKLMHDRRKRMMAFRTNLQDETVSLRRG